MEKPILFSSPMVQAILRGEKTQTRRIINPQPKDCSESHKKFTEAVWKNDSVKFSDQLNPGYWYCSLCGNGVTIEKPGFKCPYKVGDILWVRETTLKLTNGYAYRADGSMNEKFMREHSIKWKPSIFMPREAARIFLRIKSIRIERLNDISEADAIAEGVERWIEERMKSKPTHYKVYYQNCKPEDLMSYTSCPIDSYETLWQKINGEKSWSENPFVWVYEFEIIKLN